MLKLIKFIFFIFLLRFSLENELNPIEIPVNGSITINKTKEVHNYFYLNLSGFHMHDRIDIDISFENENLYHNYGFDFKLDYDINFKNLERLYSFDCTNKGKGKDTYSTFHFHIYLNLFYKYLLGSIYISGDSITITHVRPEESKWNIIIIIMIVIGVICLSTFCFFLGRITKNTRNTLYGQGALNQPFQPNINENQQEEGQSGVISNRQQEPNNIQSQPQGVEPNNIISQQQQNLLNNNNASIN